MPHVSYSQSSDLNGCEPAKRPYEAPVVLPLGTLAELTGGIVPITTDGLGPGSTL